jgi:hypothetical protein
MTRKTASLSFPTNALASMRELQDLDQVPRNDKPEEPAQPHDNATPPPDPRATGSEVGGVDTLADRSSHGREAAKLSPAKRHRRDVVSVEPSADPIASAVRELLARPYPTDKANRAVTVSTVKIPSEVWERLGWASKLLGQTKQDIISDALKDYFQKLLRQL